MNAGTFTQILPVSSYKPGSAAGSRGLEKQCDSASFMDMFAQSLRDSGKSGTKASGKRQDSPVEPKAQDTETARDHQISADQGSKDRTLEEGECRNDSKKADPEAEDVREANDSEKNRGDTVAAEESMSIQAMMALWQEVPVDMQEAGKTQAQDTGMQLESVLEAAGSEQAMSGVLELNGYGQQAAVQYQGLSEQEVTQAAQGQIIQGAADPVMEKQSAGGTAPELTEPAKAESVQTDAAVPVKVHRDDTQQSGEDMFSGMEGRQEGFRSVASEQSGSVEEEPKEVNQVLEELKRNAEAKGLDLTDKAVQTRMNCSLRPVSGAGTQLADTPVLEQLKTGLERAVGTGTQELTIHLKPEGLGDIVVHLANAGEKMTVRIGVTNPETEKLVTSQMESLKDMLRPLNAEVQEVYHSSQNAMDFSGFSQQMPEHRGQRAHTDYVYRDGTGSGSEEDLRMEAERMMAESHMSRLYAYI